MPIGTALAVGLGVAGAATGVAGAIGQAVAGSDAASANERARLADIEAQREQRKAAIAAAEPTAFELQAQEKQLQQTERAIERQEKLLSAVDPTLIEAGRQALQLLQGQEAGTLDPLRRQRGRQRQELEAQLRQQLGSGFATSSAGIEALTRFDEQTASVQSQEQQRAIGTLLGSAQNTRQLSQIGFEGSQAFGNIVGQSQTGRNQRLNAILGTPIGSEASARALGAAERSQAVGSAFGGVSKLGGTLAGIGLGQSLGKKPKTPGEQDTTETNLGDFGGEPIQTLIGAIT